MKRSWILCALLLALSILLCACSSATATGKNGSYGFPPAETDELLCFPGISWGTSMEEAMDALNADESDCEIIQQIGNQERILFENATWFGEEATRAQLMFDNDKLISVVIEYPDEADMEKVRGNLEAIYGSPADSYTTYRCPLSFETGYEKGEVVSAEFTTNNQTAFWVSSKTYGEYLGAEDTTKWVNRTRAANAANPYSTAEAYEKIAALSPFSYLVCTTDGTGDFLKMNCKNVVMLRCNFRFLTD